MNSPTTSPHWPTLPKPLQAFFAKFPLYTYPPVRAPVQTPVATPTLWILPPANTEANSDLLSANIECLKWQAYLALRGLRQVQVRWDVHPDGAIDAHLPNLHVPVTDVKETIGDASSAVDGQLLAAKMIPEWVDGKLGAPNELEGYVDSAARDESRAWVSLLEGHVQKMLELAEPIPLSFSSWLSPSQNTASNDLPFTFSFSLPSFGAAGKRVSVADIELQYSEAIASLSDRLGTDQWFLGSASPTFLDALVFAYLHRLLVAKDNVRIEVARRRNLVEWERRVAAQVSAAFQRHS